MIHQKLPDFARVHPNVSVVHSNFGFIYFIVFLLEITAMPFFAEGWFFLVSFVFRAGRPTPLQVGID